MTRSVVAVGLAAAAFTLLAMLVLSSRAMPIETHLRHHAAMAELARVTDDYATFVTLLASAAEDTQAPGDGARVLLDRLATSPDRLRTQLPLAGEGTSQQNRVYNSFERFSGTLGDALSLARGLLEQQQLYAENIAYVREVGPRLVQRMRDIRLDGVAADTFQLIAGTLELARPQGSAQELELQRLLVTLARDQRIDANMPGEVTQLRDAIGAIMRDKDVIYSKIDQLAATPVPASIGGLTAASDELYRATLGSVERARTMLAVYAVLLLAAAGFVAYRLHDSYRQLNFANRKLETLNQSLEQRVAERTAELAKTLQDLRESQVQLVQAEKMSSLGQLVAGISHEINTPLLYLSSNAVLIRERLEVAHAFVNEIQAAFSIKSDGNGPRAELQARFVAALKQLKLRLQDEEISEGLDEARALAQDSIEGLGDLTEIAQSLKDFSRLDRAPVASFDVNSGLDKTLLIAKNIIKNKANVRKFYGELPEIACSPSQINQVFLNILTNAAQAIENDGEIVISTTLHDDHHIAVRIADSGCGIPVENLARIRDPFFTTKDVGTGTGLGLSIVDEIIRSHRGRLEVESEVGKGSAFTVILPICQPDGLAHAPRPRAAEGEATPAQVDEILAEAV